VSSIWSWSARDCPSQSSCILIEGLTTSRHHSLLVPNRSQASSALVVRSSRMSSSASSRAITLGPDAVSNSWRPCSPSSLRVAASAVVRKPTFVHQSESRSYRTRSSVSARLFSPHLCGCKRLTPVVSAWGSNPLLRGHGSKIRSQERIEFCTDDECARCRECP